MRFGVHTALWVEEWGEDLRPRVETAATLGFDGAEVSLLGLDEDAAGALRSTASDVGIELTATTGLSNDTDITSADPTVRANGIDHLHRAADIVAGLGGDRLCGVIYGPWGAGTTVDPDGRRARGAEALATVAPVFAERGITLGLETVNRFETDMVNTVDQAIDLADRIGAPNVGVHCDTFHMNIEEASIPDAIRRAGDRLVHFHAVANDRGVPGTGHLRWTDIARALRDIGYDDWVTLELFVRPGLSVSGDLFIWRDICPDPTAAARDGLGFLRALFDDVGGPATGGSS